MIRIFRVILAFMVFINFARCQASENQSQANTQTELSQETKPLNIPADVKKEIEGLSSTIEAERVAAAVKLGEMGKKAKPAIPFLKKLLKDSDYFVTVRTKINDNTVSESTTTVSTQAALALARIGGEEVFEYLINALDHNLFSVRTSAAKALGDIGDPRAMEPLIKAIMNKYRGNLGAAGDALEKITGQRFYEYEEWKKWWEQNKENFMKNR